MSLADTLTSIFVLLMIFLLGYCKFTKKTLKDVIIEVREAFREETTEVIDLGI